MPILLLEYSASCNHGDVCENSNTSNIADYKRVVPKPRGKPEAFTKRENTAMSFVFREMAKERGWTQEVAGAKLGVNQQNAGKLIRGDQGFSRPSAMALAMLCGFDSPDTMLRELKAKSEASDAPTGWNNRDIAANHARAIGYSDAAVDGVIGRFTSFDDGKRAPKWWMDRIVNEEKELEASAVEAPKSGSTMPAPDPGIAKPTKRRRRNA